MSGPYGAGGFAGDPTSLARDKIPKTLFWNLEVHFDLSCGPGIRVVGEFLPHVLSFNSCLQYLQNPVKPLSNLAGWRLP